MTAALGLGPVLAAWTLLPFPLAVLVGRTLGAQGAAAPIGRVPAPASALGLTAC